MHYTGQGYRPPMESDTPLIEITMGWSHNRCALCTMYDRTPFSASKLEGVNEDSFRAKTQERPRKPGGYKINEQLNSPSFHIVTGEAIRLLWGFLLFELIFLSCAASFAQDRQMRYFTQPVDVTGSATPYGDNSATGKYVQSGDARIYYETYGQGAPVIVLHGGGVGSPYELGQIIDELRKSHKVIVVSSRGRGHSEIGHSPISLEQKAGDVFAVMRKELAAPAPVIGFSDGAYTAYMLAKQHPESLEKLIAIGAGTLKPGFFPDSLLTEELEKIDPAYVAQMRSMMPEPERLQEFLNNYMGFWNRAEIGKNLLGVIKCPVLLIGGDRDTHAPPETALEADRMIPDSRLCIVPEAGHAAFLDNFPVTWTAIRQFLWERK